MDALEALDAASGASDLVTDFTLAYLSGMMTGIGAPPEVVDQLRSRRNEKGEVQTHFALSMSVTYHGVTRVDLRRNQGTGCAAVGFYGQLSKTFVEITQERARAIGKELKKLFQRPRASRGRNLLIACFMTSRPVPAIALVSGMSLDKPGGIYQQIHTPECCHRPSNA